MVNQKKPLCFKRNQSFLKYCSNVSIQLFFYRYSQKRPEVVFFAGFFGGFGFFASQKKNEAKKKYKKKREKFFVNFLLSKRRFLLNALSPPPIINTYKQKQPDDINHMPIPSSSFKSKMMLFRKMRIK